MKKNNKRSIGYFKRFNVKISMLGLTSSLIGLFMTVAVSYFGISHLSLDSSKEIKAGISNVTREYSENYLSMTNEMVETKIEKFFEEQAVLGDIYQKYADSMNQTGELAANLSKLPDIKDNLKFNGRWYQNSGDEQAVVLVPRYLLDKDNSIKPEVKKQIDQSAVLDWLMPSVYKYGAKKLWIYFQGGRDASFMRITPWNDAGSSMDKIYPEFTDREMWDEFNPGLVDAWEKRIKEDNKDALDLASYAIVKPPTQDGGTGKIIMTLDYPVWNLNRDKFIGAICVDVELDEIIKYIENVKLAKTGFAFISQSNGNIFAINDNGLKLLGLKNVDEATVKGNNGAGYYNKMQRFLSDSTYESVKNIKLSVDDKFLNNEININGKDYIVVQKNLKPLNTWNKDRGFFKESWTLGFVVPKEELYSSYIASQNKINESKNKVLIIQFIIAAMTLLLIALVIHFATRKITENLRKLESAAVNIMNKDYDFSIDVKSDDEFGKLASTMNNMAAEIKSSFLHLNIQNELLTKEIAEREDKERKIKYLEEYDSLTNLPNEKLLNKILDEKISGDEKPDNIVVALLGIDDFRNVNEVFGYSTGNKVLKFLADRLRALSKDDGIAARINGDEFAVIYYNTQSVDDVAKKVEGLLNAVNQGFIINKKKIYLTACIGISSYPADTNDISELIQLSSSAFIHAKERGNGNYQFYSKNMNQNAEKRIAMITELRNAINMNELELYYQPQISLKDKKYVGIEALIRWNSKTFGMVMPGTFIPLAEETGLILDIGEWVLKTACVQAKKWYDSGYKNLRIGVNVSPLQFKQDKMVDNFKSIINEVGLLPELLELEVTEGIFIDDTENVVQKLNELRKFGIKIAVDDFGTGYSSLSYIKDLPIDKLKIDRSFIKEIPHNDKGTIADIIINLARSLNVSVTAEGVETPDQENFLIERSCSEAQGYYYSVPLNADDLTEKLRVS